MYCLLRRYNHITFRGHPERTLEETTFNCYTWVSFFRSKKLDDLSSLPNISDDIIVQAIISSFPCWLSTDLSDICPQHMFNFISHTAERGGEELFHALTIFTNHVLLHNALLTIQSFFMGLPSSHFKRRLEQYVLLQSDKFCYLVAKANGSCLSHIPPKYSQLSHSD